MLGRSNLVALVGGGKKPLAAPNKVLIYDCQSDQMVAELGFKTPVLNIMMARDSLLVVSKIRIDVFSVPTFELQETFETYSNPRGLAAVNWLGTQVRVAILGSQPGQVHLVDVGASGRSPVMFQAHQHALAALAMAPAGGRLASSSVRGTIIRVFDTKTGAQLHEFRRGYTAAEMLGLTFSRNATILCAASDRTAHLFAVDGTATGGTNSTTTAPRSASSGAVVASGSESRSWTMFLHGQQTSFKTIELPFPGRCCFTLDGQSLMVACRNGALYAFSLSEGSTEEPAVITLFREDDCDMFRVRS
ncbi:uncharacterized protein MONBRDRAFT_7960 [Monosiga brevicollis MX1]|uniref:Uncharacterized protein n=1 Tax=Monosiga brevicollis TaxID=81824 RepID=A9UYL8_MONBE|nr:uncharacterized protein MONBRDRAFT_7960 [Monosiga brevicollis MX1]EDQ89627.1 predicted protein [Monosiga brevicollis MX1]|eukprot:XP_001745656.1 hypothetical protein [Monosiga brevicollis MX1]